MPENNGLGQSKPADKLRKEFAEFDRRSRRANAGSGKVFDARGVFFTSVAIVMFAVLVGLIVTQKPSRMEEAPVWSPDAQRELANKLSETLPGMAVAAYQKYLDSADIPGAERAGVCYTVAKLAMSEGDYETALAFLYQAQVAGPDAALETEINTKMVSCLERLDRLIDAQNVLTETTSLGRPEKDVAKGEVILARIGNDVVTEGDLNREIQKMPPWSQRNFSEPEQKAQFLKQYLAEHLLYKKALRMELDKDPEVMRQAQDYLRQSVVRKLLDDEVKSKVKTTPEDVRLYYDANKDTFVEKAKARAAHILIKDETKAKELIEKIEGGEKFEELAREHSEDEKTKEKGGELAGWITEGGSIPGIGPNPEFVKAIFETEKGKTTGLIEDDSGSHIFKVLEKKAQRQRPFDEVQKEAGYQYRAMKEGEEYRRMIEDILKAENVEMFENRLFTGSSKDKKVGT
jgi:peptidyl-prolyl cis-trans isomerase C